MNIFSAQARCWEAVCQMAMSLTNPSVPNWDHSGTDPYKFRDDLLYVATHSAGGRYVLDGEIRHKVEDLCFDGQWEGYARGVEEVWWTSATSGARLAVFLNDDLQSYTVRFVGTMEDCESSYLLEFYRAVTPDTIRVEEINPGKLAKLVEGMPVTEAEVLNHLYSAVFKTAKEKAMS